MRFYLLRPDGCVSDAGEYPQQPPERSDGMWMPGFPPEDSHPIQPLLEQLQQIFETEISLEAQADLAPLKAAIKMEMEQGRMAVARLIIQRAQIPDTLKPVQDQLLAALAVEILPLPTELENEGD